MEPLTHLQVLFGDEGPNKQQFTEGFLAQVSLEHIQAIIAEMKQKHGRFIGASRLRDKFGLDFEKMRIPTEIHLDAAGRMSGLQFGVPISTGDLAALISDIANLPGHTSVLVVSDGKTVGKHEPDKPLAVASAFKLAVLLAVKRQVLSGLLSWSHVVNLDPAWKSLESGQLQDWPDYTPVTIATLANLMISVSDNTATDALIRIIGRDEIEAITPQNAPLLTTREYFILESNKHKSLREIWRTGDKTNRLQILDQLRNEPLPGYDQLGIATHSLVWQLTAREICKLLDKTADLPSVKINSGPADPNEWKEVAYKGGSLAGVLNQSSRLVGHDGSIHLVIATWNNDSDLNEEPFRTAYRGILSKLAQSSVRQ